MIRRTVAALALAAVTFAANPRRQPMKTCGACGKGNEPDRTQCWNCQAAI